MIDLPLLVVIIIIIDCDGGGGREHVIGRSRLVQRLRSVQSWLKTDVCGRGHASWKGSDVGESERPLCLLLRTKLNSSLESSGWSLDSQ